MSFNPFESRLCRDIRNNLGHDFVKSIQKNNSRHFKNAVKAYPPETITADQAVYIRHRVICLEKVFGQMAACGIKSGDYHLIAVILWNLELFFEFHEWIEIQWTVAHGENKKALQALILSAVVYEQLEYGRKIPAQKVAVKAILLFEQYGYIIPDPFDINLFLLKLGSLDPVAPKFTLTLQNP